jgi:hypothetical protein
VTTLFAGLNIGSDPQVIFPKMSGRGGGRNNGRGGRGHGGRGGCGRGRGQNYTGSANKTKECLCVNLGTNVFDYGQKSAADLMRTSWEKPVQYVGTNYGQDIINELQDTINVDIIEPVHSYELLRKHGLREAMIRSGEQNIQRARQAQEIILKAAVVENDPDAPMKLAILQNEISQGEFSSSNKGAMELNDSVKTQFSNEWRTIRECNVNLIKHRGQAFSLNQGQCTQLLQDKMKQDTEWTNVSTSNDPLTMYLLIQRTVLAQTEDQYPFTTVYDQELSFYSFMQENVSNPQWYERFSTKVDVGDAIGVTHYYKVILEYVSQETHTSLFADLGAAEQRVVRDDAEERYISYAFLRKSGKQHGNLKVDLQNDFTTDDNRYTKNRQQNLHLLDKYNKTDVAKVTQSEGISFAQRSGRGGGRGGRSGNGKSHDKLDNAYWKDTTCYKCKKKGHATNKFPKKSNNDNYEKYMVSAASSAKKLKKDFKSKKKAFTTVKTQLKKLKEADSDLSGSEDDDNQ